ncbi:hypothetical protein AYI68_g639 [Smittium mucronatum]|uniref:Uncharacterized protein n=1 Tax=Smittium mucronatum TaxID=133383 RepID=A0A1R0H7M0_9FUNG|nr:hypothetical protein AYI68_g639 [Smittium mucronatum]
MKTNLKNLKKNKITKFFLPTPICRTMPQEYWFKVVDTDLLAKKYEICPACQLVLYQQLWHPFLASVHPPTFAVTIYCYISKQIIDKESEYAGLNTIAATITGKSSSLNSVSLNQIFAK